MASTTDIPGPRVQMRNPTSRTDTEPSVSSKTSKNSGPSSKEPALIKSTWGMGWQTPTLMLVSYVSALAIAIGHLLLFRFLDGKEADGHHQVASQSYVSTASNILANIFGFLFRASLAIAFIQYLWHLLRVSTMKVSTIELLFSIRSNPFVLFRPAALRATPVLFALSIVMWASQIVISFPPGAITVVSTQQSSFGTVIVPTFNALFMGNGSGVDASTYSLSTLVPVAPDGFNARGLEGNKDASLMTRLAFQVLVTGESFAMASPCGANCSYVIEFEGPYVDCNHTSTNITIDGPTLEFLIYNGTWLNPRSVALGQPPYNGTFTLAHFTSSSFTPLLANADAFFDSDNGSVVLQQDELVCIPGRAAFVLNNTWESNIPSRTISTKPIDPLINLVPPTHGGEVLVPGFCLNGTDVAGTEVANWSTSALAYYRDNNIMAIIDAMMLELAGSFKASLDKPSTLPSVTGPINDSLLYNNLVWDQFIGIISSAGNNNAALNGTHIDSTRLNTAFGKFSASDAAHPAFNITQDILNDYLFNITTSIMTAYGEWATTSNATISNTVNVYSFSRPLNLILPYFISLLLAIPFILIGGLALHRNGVSAMDGGFMQVIATSTGSAILDKAAAGGCLGGDESVPQELKDLEIRFGEIIGREDARIRRAGFGVESEITALKKGENYGIARWI